MKKVWLVALGVITYGTGCSGPTIDGSPSPESEVENLPADVQEGARFGSRMLDANVRTRLDPRAAVRIFRAETDERGTTHVVAQQLFDGVPVRNGSSIIHVTGDLRVESVDEFWVQQVSVDTKPAFAPWRAVGIVANFVQCEACVDENAKLIIIRQDGRDYLTYEVHLMEPGAAHPDTLFWVDAHDGQIVESHSGVLHGAATGSGLTRMKANNNGAPISFTTWQHTDGKYYLEDHARGIGVFAAGWSDPGSEVGSYPSGDAINNKWPDESENGSYTYASLTGDGAPMLNVTDNDHYSVVDAHTATKFTYDYYKLVHGWTNAVPLSALKSVDGVTYLRALWLGLGNQCGNAPCWVSNGQYVRFPRFSSPTTRNGSESIDIVGHEFTHGVIGWVATGGVEGAVNEGWADVVGSLVEYYGIGEFNYAHTTNMWRLAELWWTTATLGDALRRLDKPHCAPKADPQDASGGSTCTNAQCDTAGHACNTPGNHGSSDHVTEGTGGHDGAGIIGHAFYLLAKGGTHHLSGTSVTSIGIAAAANIWVRALRYHFSPLSPVGFDGAQLTTCRAATELYGIGSSQHIQVGRAWYAVGVGTTLSCPADSPTVFVTSTSHTGNIGGLAGADGICTERAQAAGLADWWLYKAWMSTAMVNASARLQHANGSYVLPTGTVVANNWTDLTDGTLLHAIDRDESGNTVPPLPEGITYVWTATGSNGNYNPSGDCSDWSSTSGSAVYGSYSSTNYAWSGVGARPCNESYHLYCFQR